MNHCVGILIPHASRPHVSQTQITRLGIFNPLSSPWSWSRHARHPSDRARISFLPCLALIYCPSRVIEAPPNTCLSMLSLHNHTLTIAKPVTQSWYQGPKSVHIWLRIPQLFGQELSHSPCASQIAIFVLTKGYLLFLFSITVAWFLILNRNILGGEFCRHRFFGRFPLTAVTG